MNGNFERSGTYPFSTQPKEGYAVASYGPERIIINIAHRGKGVKVNEGDTFEIVELDQATVFPDVIAATVAAGKLAERLRA